MWLTVAQLAQLQNISPQAIRKSLSKGRYTTARYEESAARGGSAGKVWTISVYDPAIPDAVRRNLGIEERAVKLKAKMKEDAQMTIKPENLENGQTAQRLRVVRRAESCPEGVKMRDWLEWLSRDENVSVPTIYRWVKDSKRGKIVSDRAGPRLARSVKRPAAHHGAHPQLRSAGHGIRHRAANEQPIHGHKDGI